EVRAHDEPRADLARARRRARLDVGEIPDVRAQLVVLALDARLEVPEGRQDVVATVRARELLAALERQVDPRERLHAAVVQRAGDPVALPRGAERVALGLEAEPLLAEVGGEIADHGEVDRPHDVEVRLPLPRPDAEAQFRA